MQTTQQLPAQIKRIWALSAVGSLCVGVIITVGLGVANWLWNWPSWLVWVALGLTITEFIVELALVLYRYRFSEYVITDNAVEIQSGFIFRNRIAIPIARIQNVTLKAGPLMQWQHLEQVVIATAATTHDIEGVQTAVATRLRELIMARAMEVQDNDL